MTRQVILGDGAAWDPPDAVFDAALARVAAQLPTDDPLGAWVEGARRGGADLRGLDRASLARLLEAVHTAYVRLVRVWRAGFPDDDHDELIAQLGSLAQGLEAAVPAALEDWSIRRLQAFGGALEAGFPRELQRVLLPLLQHDVAQAERVLRALRDRDLEEDASAIGGAAFLPNGARERYFVECARHRREDVRFTLFTVLSRRRALPDPGSLTTNLADEVTDALLRAGVTDPSPRVRSRAIAYAYGLGQVARVRAELVAAVAPATGDPDESCRVHALLALGLLDGADTRAALQRAYERGASPEASAAVWALARRRDGVVQVVAAVDDPRPDVRSEAIAAIAHVAGPLDAEALAWLEAPERAAEVHQAVDHHRRRAGVPEPGFRLLVTGRLT